MVDIAGLLLMTGESPSSRANNAEKITTRHWTSQTGSCQARRAASQWCHLSVKPSHFTGPVTDLPTDCSKAYPGGIWYLRGWWQVISKYMVAYKSQITPILEWMKPSCGLLVSNMYFTISLYYLRDWSRSGGRYGNNTRVICCPAPRRPESAARGTSPPDNKSRGCCCRNSRPTVINPDYNMTKQLCMKHIYDKIRSKPPPNGAPSHTCLHCDVTHLSLTAGIVALPIPSWSVRGREKRVRHVKLCGQLMQDEYFVTIEIIYMESPITINILIFFLGSLSRRFKHNHN